MCNIVIVTGGSRQRREVLTCIVHRQAANRITAYIVGKEKSPN